MSRWVGYSIIIFFGSGYSRLVSKNNSNRYHIDLKKIKRVVAGLVRKYFFFFGVVVYSRLIFKNRVSGTIESS